MDTTPPPLPPSERSHPKRNILLTASITFVATSAFWLVIWFVAAEPVDRFIEKLANEFDSLIDFHPDFVVVPPDMPPSMNVGDTADLVYIVQNPGSNVVTLASIDVDTDVLKRIDLTRINEHTELSSLRSDIDGYIKYDFPDIKLLPGTETTMTIAIRATGTGMAVGVIDFCDREDSFVTTSLYTQIGEE